MSDYDYDSDGYEVENEYEYEQTKLDQEGSERYRKYLVTRNTAQIEDYKKDDKELEQVYVNMFSDEDTDEGLLSGAGGYYSVARVNINTLYIRKAVINALTFRFLLKLNKIKLKPGNTMASVGTFNDFRKSVKERGLIKKDNNWKDFKTYLTMKFMTNSDTYVSNVYNNAIKQEFNTNYLEFLISKSRFIYNKYGLDQTMDSLKALHDSIEKDPMTQEINNESELKDDKYSFFKNSFFDKLQTAKVIRIKEHSYAFKNFSMLVDLPFRTEDWDKKHENLYENFLNRANTISYIEVNVKYNISYVSKRNTDKLIANKQHKFKDNVLDILKKLITSIAVDFCEQGKCFRLISSLKRNLTLNLDTLLRFMDAAGCNYTQLCNDDMNTIIIQTNLNNLLIFSTPIKIFSKRFMLCKDVSFCKIDFTGFQPKNVIMDDMKEFQKRMFYSGMDEVAYDNFILCYYSRLANIDETHLENWMSKMRKLKAKILQSSSYCRHICAIKIQCLYRKLKFTNFYKRKNIERIIKNKLLKQREKFKELQDLELLNYIENRSSVIITKFLRYVGNKKVVKPFQEKYEEIKYEYKKELINRLHNKIYNKMEYRISELKQLEYQRPVRHAVVSNGFFNIPHNYNNEKMWFGFNRNESLRNLIISTGYDVQVLEIKNRYNQQEFLKVIECLADVCSCTKSYQFVKLCRSLSGRKHNANTIKDFMEGFCWMFKKCTREQFLHMVNLFCKSTNNNKFMIYICNNMHKIESNLHLW